MKKLKQKLKKMLSPWYLIKMFVVFIGIVVVSAYFFMIASKIVNFVENPIKVYGITKVNIRHLTEQDRAIKQANLVALEVLNGTPMENAKKDILKAVDYYELPVELYLGIANAESSFRNFKCYNPWGIGNPTRCYNNWSHSVDGFSVLIKYYYFEERKITADEMWRKYQGGTNPDWITNVKKYY